MAREPEKTDPKNNDRPSKEPTTQNCCCGSSENYILKKEDRCCQFDIVMTRMRVLENKDGKAELMICGYANDQQAVFPGLGLWVVHHKKWGWRNIQKRIASFCVPEDGQMVVRLNADAIEAGTALEGNFEIGSSEDPKNLTLTCGSSEVQTLIVDVKGVKNTNAGNIKAKIEIEFMSVQTSRCCC